MGVSPKKETVTIFYLGKILAGVRHSTGKSLKMAVMSGILRNIKGLGINIRVSCGK